MVPFKRRMILGSPTTPGGPALAATSVAPVAPRAAAPGWDALLVCVAIFLAFDVGRIHQLFPQLIPLRPILLSALASIALYALGQRGPRRARTLKHPITYCVLGILALVAWSVPFSLGPRRSFEFLYSEFAKTVVLFLLVAASVRTVKDVERLAKVFLYSAVLYAVVAIARDQTVSSERLDNLYTYDSNDFALFAVVALPLAFYFLAGSRRLLGRAIGLFSIVALCAGIMLSGSRGGFLAGAGLLLFYLFANRSAKVWWRASVVATVVIAGFVAAQGWYWERIDSLLHVKSDYNVTTPYGRIEIWKRGIGYMLSRPLTGVGAANFGKAEGTLSELAHTRAEEGKGTPWKAAHNSFVQIGAELGVPGLLALLGLLWAGFRAMRRTGAFTRARRVGPKSSPESALAFALAGSLLAWMIAAFFLAQAYYDIIYGVAGLVLGLAKVQRETGRRLARAQVAQTRAAAQLLRAGVAASGPR